MNPPHNTSIEHIFDEWAKGDSIVITHKIENTPEGKAKKREVSRELTE